MESSAVIRAIRTPVTLLLLLLFVFLVGRWGWDAARAPIPPRPHPPCEVVDVGPELTPDRVYVRVYNGTSENGLARRLAPALRADGFRVFEIENTPEPTYVESVVVGYAEDSPEVVLVRQAFDNIAFKADARADRTVDVIIGTNQPVVIAEPVLTVPLPDGKACLARPDIVSINSGG